MGKNSNIPLNGVNNKSATSMHSKGDRLGWLPLSEEKTQPLRSIVGNGERVIKERYATTGTNAKLLVP